MAENRMQRIEPSPISLVAKRIDSISFECGSPEQDQDSIKGKFNITNSITGNREIEDIGHVLSANLRLSIEPEDGFSYYRLDLSVSGIFSKNKPDIADDEFEKAVLSDGISELYSYAKSVTSTIVDGGVFGDIAFPILKIGF